MARRRDETRAGRERLAAGLRERGFAPLEGVANFLCVDVGDGAAFASRLERQGVIVRPLGPFGDPASVRISVGSDEELTRLFAAIDAGSSRTAALRAATAVLMTAGATLLVAPALARPGAERITPAGVGGVGLGKLYAALRANHLVGPMHAACELAGPQARSARCAAR